MKTTLELPDPLLRKAKATASERGQSLKQFVADALRDKLADPARRSAAADPAWMAGFGKLKRLKAETRRVQASIDAEFGVLEAEDRA